MKYFKKMTGKKVYLSPINIEDYEIFTKWFNDDEMLINITTLPNIVSLSGEKSFVENMAKSNNDFCIVDLATDNVIGTCGYIHENRINRTAELGIVIGDKDYWGKGYGSDAIKLLLDFGFKARNYHNIMLRALSHNQRAIKCYEKCGFKEFGRQREAVIYGDKKFDLVHMDILASEHKTDYLDKYLV